MRALAAAPHARIEGYDVARALAIVGMILINFQVYLLEPSSGAPDRVIWAWLSHLPSGRSSALFVTLAGAGISLMAKRAGFFETRDRWPVARTLLTRALVLIVAGNLLKLGWSIDILHFYAFYLALAALVFGLSDRALLGLAATVALAGGAIGLATLELSRRDYEYWSPSGMAIDVFVNGVHPVIPWFSFVLVGLWLGRRDLRDPRVRARLMIGGGAMAVGAELLSLALGALLARGLPAEGRVLLSVLGTSWSPDPLYVVSASGSSVFLVALAQSAVERWRTRWGIRALVATGQLALSIYILHALVGVGIPKWGLGLADAMSLRSVVLYWLAFTVAIVGLATVTRRWARIGPLEWVLRRLAPSPEAAGSVAGATEPGLSAPASTAWLAGYASLGLGLGLVTAARFVGVAGPSLDCPPDASLPSGDGVVVGELSLACPQRHYRLDVGATEHVTLETTSGQDTYLELFTGPERVAWDDDSGLGVDARLTEELPAGAHRVRVRPYAASTGVFVLRVSRKR